MKVLWFFLRTNQLSIDGIQAETQVVERDVGTPDGMPVEDGADKQRTGRKRTRNPDQWKCALAKRRREAGQEYESRHGNKVRPAREVKTSKDCGNCRFKCRTLISETERQEIHRQFWSLDPSGKDHFYDMNTVQLDKSRKRTKQKESSRKKTTQYSFHLNGRKIRVCMEYFCATLDISHQRIKYFHKVRKDKTIDGCIRKSQWGIHSKMGIRVKTEDKDGAREHIRQLPRVESHYCRKSTSREYLESNLTINKLYDMYVDWCTATKRNPVKKHMYGTIFKSEFNIAFAQPKKDRCDVCESHRLKEKENTLSEDEKLTFVSHRASVESSREERKKDKETADVVLSFDLENVLTLPKADVSNFFYRRKLSCYNLTGHLSTSNTAYCCIWTEALCGRKGNDIASAVIKMLECIISEQPDLKHITLWSDSCVPQNKNSVMSLALKKFLEVHPTVISISQKYSEKGHSCIQEVDAIHSCIERAMRNTEVYSPLGLIRVIANMRRKGKVQVIQMKQTDFFDFQSAAKALKFTTVPFTQVKQLKYLTGTPFHVTFKLDHNGQENTASIRVTQKTRKNKDHPLPTSLPPIKNQTFSGKPMLSKEKLQDLEAMLEFMPFLDRHFMKTHCQLK